MGTRKSNAKRLASGGGKLIGYVRVSTLDQGEHGHSLDAQRTRLREVAEREGYELIDILLDVASGANVERDGIAEARARVDAGEAEGLVFVKLDRLGRSMGYVEELLAWSKDQAGTLISTEEGVYAERGKLIHPMPELTIALATWQRRYISERTKAGLAAAKAKGIRLGRPPLAWDERLDRRVARLYARGCTVKAIAKKLNDEGTRTPSGGRFHVTTVRRMIDRALPNASRVASAVA